MTSNAVMQHVAGTATARHIEESRALLSGVGGHGFPTFALQLPDRKLFVLDIGSHLGKPEAWKQHLIEVIATTRDSIPINAAGAVCGPDSCEIQ